MSEKYKLNIHGCFYFSTVSEVEADSLEEAIQLGYNNNEYDPIAVEIEDCKITKVENETD